MSEASSSHNAQRVVDRGGFQLSSLDVPDGNSMEQSAKINVHMELREVKITNIKYWLKVETINIPALIKIDTMKENKSW